MQAEMKQKPRWQTLFTVGFVGVWLIGMFVFAIWFGRRVALDAIKSELVWHNQYVLEEAIEDMRRGDLDSAEKKIRQVNANLEKMKKRK